MPRQGMEERVARKARYEDDRGVVFLQESEQTTSGMLPPLSVKGYLTEENTLAGKQLFLCRRSASRLTMDMKISPALPTAWRLPSMRRFNCSYNGSITVQMIIYSFLVCHQALMGT